MTIMELLERNHFHDSFINGAEVVGEDLHLSIIFCTYDQEYYVEGEMPEQEVIRLEFKNFILEKEEDFNFNGNSILQEKAIYKDGIVCGIEFVLVGDKFGSVSIIKIFADSVEWISCGEPDWS